MKLLNHSFHNIKPFENRHPPNMTKNEHVYAMCCRPEVAGDVISGGNVNTNDGYAMLPFEAVTNSSFRYNQNQQFA